MLRPAPFLILLLYGSGLMAAPATPITPPSPSIDKTAPASPALPSGVKAKPQPTPRASGGKSKPGLPSRLPSRGVSPIPGKACEINGTVTNVPNYLHIRVDLTSSNPYRVEGNINVPAGTARQEFRFPGLECTNPPEHIKTYRLKYKFARNCCYESSPRRGNWKQAFSDVFIPDLTKEQQRFTDISRDFHNFTTSGILLRGVETDRSHYEFGDIIRYSFRAYIRGSTLPGVSRREQATYTVSVSSGGFTSEVDSGTLDIRLGSEERITIPIHHVNYSRGSNSIKIVLNGRDYECSYSINRMIE